VDMGSSVSGIWSLIVLRRRLGVTERDSEDYLK
jgi:hypothetical protein